MAESIPALPEISPAVAAEYPNLVARRAVLVGERAVLRERTGQHNDACNNVEEDSPEAARCDIARTALVAETSLHIQAAKQFIAMLETAHGKVFFLYALQTRTLIPMAGGGHPIDAPGAPPLSLRGLVGGTTWTYGFRRPYVKCEKKCQDGMKRNLEGQLTLFCSSQRNPKACLAAGLPFTPDMYDLVVSMGSSHSAIEDLATRVLFDGATFGEFSRQNKEIFASLKGREFATLDCHSNGALVCLAALRSGDTHAKEVRLFGPQMNPEAAKRWQEYAANTNTTIKIYINNGDPVTAISWKQPAPQGPIEKAFTAAWLSSPATGPAAFAEALFHTYADSKTGVMDKTLKEYGFEVTRSSCKDLPNIDCHSMTLYETKVTR
ncbi:MAG: hypothetical protein ACKVQA_11930 [Burkholderiales bacterium]